MTHKILIAILFAGAAFGSSIAVTGSGTFSNGIDVDENGANVFFSGSSSAGSVSLFANGVPIGPAPPSSLFAATTIYNPYLASSPGATIDGVHSDYWAFQVGGGLPGYLELLDGPSGKVIMEQDITGYIQTTQYEEHGSRFNSDGTLNLNWYASGSFAVIPAPEAESGLLVGVGFAALLLGRKTAPRQS